MFDNFLTKKVLGMMGGMMPTRVMALAVPYSCVVKINAGAAMLNANMAALAEICMRERRDATEAEIGIIKDGARELLALCANLGPAFAAGSKIGEGVRALLADPSQFPALENVQ